MSENVYLSTALKREANSRGCRGTKIEEKSSEKPLRSSFDFWSTFYEDLGPFLRAFWAHFVPQNACRNETKNRSDFGGFRTRQNRQRYQSKLDDLGKNCFLIFSLIFDDFGRFMQGI